MDRLAGECTVFCRYLIGVEPTDYVAAKYREYHALPCAASMQGTAADRLVAFASRHPVATLIADTYARFFAPRSVLRKKLILVLAILETTAPFSDHLDSVPRFGLVRLGLRLACAAAVTAVVVVMAAAFVVPWRLWACWSARRPVEVG